MLNIVARFYSFMTLSHTTRNAISKGIIFCENLIKYDVIFIKRSFELNGFELWVPGVNDQPSMYILPTKPKAPEFAEYSGQNSKFEIEYW